MLDAAGRPQLVATARSLSVQVEVGLKEALAALFADLGHRTDAAVLAARWHASRLACEHLRAFLTGREQVSPSRDEDVEIVDALVHWLGLHLVRDVPVLTALATATVPATVRTRVDEVEKTFRADGMPAVQHLVGLSSINRHARRNGSRRSTAVDQAWYRCERWWTRRGKRLVCHHGGQACLDNKG